MCTKWPRVLCGCKVPCFMLAGVHGWSPPVVQKEPLAREWELLDFPVIWTALSHPQIPPGPLHPPSLSV